MSKLLSVLFTCVLLSACVGEPDYLALLKAEYAKPDKTKELDFLVSACTRLAKGKKYTVGPVEISEVVVQPDGKGTAILELNFRDSDGDRIQGSKQKIGFTTDRKKAVAISRDFILSQATRCDIDATRNAQRAAVRSFGQSFSKGR